MVSDENKNNLMAEMSPAMVMVSILMLFNVNWFIRLAFIDPFPLSLLAFEIFKLVKLMDYESMNSKT